MMKYRMAAKIQVLVAAALAACFNINEASVLNRHAKSMNVDSEQSGNMTISSGFNMCSQNGDLTRKLRAKFGRPEGFKSCAVVGSSGILLKTRLGKEIDDHEFVVRMNNAPVGGFEEIVGSKTSLRVMNTESIITDILERVCPQLKAGSKDFCPNYGIYINSMSVRMHTAVRQLQDACPHIDPIVSIMNDLPKSDAALSHFDDANGNGNIMTGEWGISLATHLCPNGMDVYGYTHADNAKLSDGTRYHYYDYETHYFFDDISLSAKTLTSLSEKQPQCVRLHTPSELADEYPCPKTRPTVDPLVDGIQHKYDYMVYMEKGFPPPSLQQPYSSIQCPYLYVPQHFDFCHRPVQT